MLITLFQWCDRGVRFAAKALLVLHQGFWLGVLKAEKLDALTQLYYDRAQKYSDQSYTLSGFCDWEKKIITDHFEFGSRILVAAAGGGRELAALSDAGFCADGFDCNRRFVRAGLELAQKLGLSYRIMLAPPYGVPADIEMYDGAIIGWGGYMHLVGREQRVLFLRAIGAHLTGGAPLLLSFFQQTPKSRSHVWAARIANVIRAAKRSTFVEPGDWIDGSFDHYFTESEIREELLQGGFEMIAYEAPGYGVAIARRRNAELIPA